MGNGGVRCVGMDMRGHGGTYTGDDDDLSADTLASLVGCCYYYCSYFLLLLLIVDTAASLWFINFIVVIDVTNILLIRVFAYK